MPDQNSIQFRFQLLNCRYSKNPDMGSSKLLRVALSLSIICVVTYGQEWPRLLFHTGETNAIPCLAHSEQKDFFWRKGDHYDASEEIAYKISGRLYSSSERYEVLSNGNLTIKNVTAEDEGKYFCLSASSSSSCYASVTVYVKVTVSPYIDLCSPRSSCTLYVKQEKTIPLTCNAKSISSQMTLKWFNGSKEIVENVKISSDKNNRNETEISTKLTLTFQEATFLTCKATDVKLESAVAHIHLVPFEEHKHSVGLIVAVSVLAVILCVVLVTTFSLILVRHYKQRHAVSKSSKDGDKHEKVLMLQQDDREKLSVALATIAAKEEALQTIKQKLHEKDQELKISMRGHEFSKRELRFQLLAKKDVYRHLCLLKMPPGKSNEFAERKSSTELKVVGDKYSYDYIFEKNATNNDIYVQFEELIQNSIDGGNSCIFVLCSSTSDTASIVFDTENKADVGVIPKAIHKLFQVPHGWKEIGISPGITATYANFDAQGKNENASFEAPKFPIKSADHALKVLKEYRDKQTMGGTPGNKQLAETSLFQFFIDTKDETEVYSTGMLMFCTFTNSELIKSCLQGKADGSTDFTKYVTSAISAPGTKMAILSVFIEGSKESAKQQLKFNEFYNGEKKNFFQRIFSKKKEENV